MIWHSTDREQFIKYIGTDIKTGLTNAEVKERLEDSGENISSFESHSFIEILLEQFKKFPVIFLAIVTIIYTVAGLGTQGFKLIEPVLIILLIAIRALIDTCIIYHSEKSTNKLSKMSATVCKVVRNGQNTQVLSSNLVVGDVILVDANDYITADARLIESVNLHCDESAISGDSVPCQKDATVLVQEIATLPERINMLYAGCTVTSGQGIAVVTETGNNTELAKANTLNYKNDSVEPLKDKLSRFHNTFQAAVWGIGTVIYILSVLLKLQSTEITFTNLITQRLLEAAAIIATVIPDCLLAMATVSLAFGVQRMLKKNALFKNIHNLKALSDINIICSDKTGTLTSNIMTVTAAFNGNGVIRLDSLTDSVDFQTANTLRLASLCTDIETAVNDPTQIAITEACAHFLKQPKNHLEALYPRIAIIPFDAVRKLMTTVNMIDGINYCIVKGAPESLIPLCPDCNSESINNAVEQMSSQALRVIGVAIKQLEEAPSNPTSEELEKNLTFIGLLGLNDRIRADVQSSIALCKKSGIKTVMITGDNILTASAIAQKLGILTAGSVAITSEQLNAMTDAELLDKIETISVFAAVSPEDKYKIIKAYRTLGKTVAITGDSVADAHALRSADIGFAMGIKGTDVAKGAADVIITDDSFCTIPEVIKQARAIFRNLRNSVRYILTCNISKLIFCFIGTAIFAKIPFSALQLIWLLIISGLTTTLSLCTDGPTDRILTSEAKNDPHNLFDKNFAINISWQSAIIAAVALIALCIGNTASAFLTITVALTLQVFNVRTKGSIFTANYKSGKYIVLAAAVSLLFGFLTACTSFGTLFGFDVNAQKVLICFMLGVIPTLCCEAVKLFAYF